MKRFWRCRGQLKKQRYTVDGQPTNDCAQKLLFYDDELITEEELSKAVGILCQRCRNVRGNPTLTPG